MKLCVALFTAFAINGINALWGIPPQYTTNEQLRQYFGGNFISCMHICHSWHVSPDGGNKPDTPAIQNSCLVDCKAIFEYERTV
ncbi:uncharacterized protein PpBr36_11514 [Pyricularia pennisetigena]|uniref:uncharacterized protein n=1 Tax=Pyricularia pennisetigena TaxID=1578925 RepID=UPI001151AAD0|nr:uncharacterized protein PpBr36_11514 [Pyricularia pennisetigena]TLS20210.1 hypothetical protein PpBr36_11514 [Pyricularia pennisetigena]